MRIRIFSFAILASSIAADLCRAEVSFRNDVMAVLAKAGCNAGACHGNKSGKGGFKLSLRGQDPDIDYNTLTRELDARRTNPMDPDQSLILLKPTTQLPHEGGRRFGKDSVEYKILRQWIADGTPQDTPATPRLVRLEVTPAEQVLVEPADRVQIRTSAIFSDGSRREISRLAVYEQSSEMAKISVDGLVQRQRDGETTVIVRYLQCQEAVRIAFVPSRPGFAWRAPSTNNYIDECVFAKLQTLRMNPSPLCNDSEFLRRAYLDLLGILPSVQETREFLASTQSNKRSQLIDELLQRPEYADFWALKWADLLRIEERLLDRKGVQGFHRWIRQSVADNKPLDQFAREIVSALGSTYTNPPTNYYRAIRDPIKRAEATAQVFLGTRLQCAQCHNHPFDRWTQDDYYSWADVFSRISYKVLENRRRDTNDGHEFIGEQIVYMAREGDVKNPRTGKPAKAKLLGDAQLSLSENDDRLEALAAWMTRPDNPFFARAQINRIWYHLMGRGIVDQIDDFRATNPPSNPALLDALTKDFVAHKFDVRHAIRLIMNSSTYQLSALPDETNRDDETNFAHVLVRRLSAEQLLDAQHEVAGVPAKFAGYPDGMRAGQIPGVETSRSRDQKATMSDRFLLSFGKPPRLLTCECERSMETTMNQAFQLISGPQITTLLSAPDNRISQLIQSGKRNEQVIEELYLSALSRQPTDKELASALGYLKGSSDRRRSLEDVTWALLNAKEFILRK